MTKYECYFFHIIILFFYFFKVGILFIKSQSSSSKYINYNYLGGKKMSKRRREPGEYTFPDDDRVNNVYTPHEDFFLNELRKFDKKYEEINILGDLKNSLVPKLKKVINSESIELKEIEWNNLETRALLKELKEILIKWRDKYNLYDQDYDNWLMKKILNELIAGICYGEKDIVERIFSPLIHPSNSGNYFDHHPDYLENNEIFNIKIEAIWNPLGKTEKEIKKDINERVNKEIKKIKCLMEKKDYQRVYPEKDLMNRFLLFQIKEKTLSDIADLEFVGEDTISKSVKKVANNVGIKRRTKV